MRVLAWNAARQDREVAFRAAGVRPSDLAWGSARLHDWLWPAIKSLIEVTAKAARIELTWSGGGEK